MKTLLIIIVLVILTIIAGYAQTTKNCSCPRKTANHLNSHHKYVAKASKTTPPLFTNRIHNTDNTDKDIAPDAYPGNDVWRYEYSVRLGKPAKTNYADKVELNKESDYTGNYPKPTVQDTRVDPRELTAPPKDRDLCLWNCR
jgi:hypothetical protein